jgi:hypothetical protein
MNYINPNQQKIKDALNKHFDFMFYVIKTKINGRNTVDKPSPEIKNVNKVTGIPNNVKAYLNDDENLSKVLRGLPSQLERIKNHFSTDEEKIALKKLFNYDSWVNEAGVFEDYNPYHLANTLNINTCPYCNRMYTKTVLNKIINGGIKKITRPEFDHWFPKAKYPLLALSFYNLIPSCHTCNSSVKGGADFTLETHIHPYVNEKINMQYSYDYDKSLNNHTFKIKFNGDTDNKAKTTAEEFKLKEIYETHEDEIKDLLRIKNVYSDTYLQKLNGLLGTSVSYDEIYRLAFGTYIEEAKFDKRPLSRMKRDILKELDIIKNENDEK